MPPATNVRGVLFTTEGLVYTYPNLAAIQDISPLLQKLQAFPVTMKLAYPNLIFVIHASLPYIVHTPEKLTIRCFTKCVPWYDNTVPNTEQVLAPDWSASPGSDNLLMNMTYEVAKVHPSYKFFIIYSPTTKVWSCYGYNAESGCFIHPELPNIFTSGELCIGEPVVTNVPLDFMSALNAYIENSIWGKDMQPGTCYIHWHREAPYEMYPYTKTAWDSMNVNQYMSNATTRMLTDLIAGAI